MAAAERSTADLIASIAGCDMLAGWHVLVAYRVDEINRILTARHAEIDKNASVSEVKQFSHTYEDPIRPEHAVEYYYNLKLGNPTVSFVKSKYSVQLSYPLAGSVGTKPDDKGDSIPEGLFLNCLADLRNVHGAYETAGGSQVLDPNEIVTFEAGKAETCHIVIDMRNPHVTVTNESGQISPELDPIVRSNLTTHIRGVGLQYQLSAVSASGNAAEAQLVPSSFLVTTVSSEAPERSALLLWIAVAGLPFSGHPDTTTKELIFSINGKDALNPIPTDKSAAIYFARNFVYSFFIKPRLEDAGLTNIKLKKPAAGNADEICVTCTPKDDQVTVEKWLLDGSEDGLANRVCEKFSFNMNTATMTMVLTKDNPHFDIQITVNGVGCREIDFVITEVASAHSDYRGQVNFTFSKHSSGHWSDGSDNKVALQFDSFDTLDVNSVTIDDPSSVGNAARMLDGMKGINVKVSSISLNLGPLNYSLTTSLLLPGGHSFKVGKIPDDLYMPRDLAIFGAIE